MDVVINSRMYAAAGGGVALTGTPVAITWAAGANPPGQSITIPADATAVYFFWSYFEATVGAGLASVTLNAAAPDQSFEVPIASGETACGVAVWYNPATGSQTLDPAWDAAPSQGPTTIVAFVKGGSTTAWRDVDGANGTAGGAVSVTIDSNTTDLVLKYDEKDGATPPSTSAGWTSRQTHTNNAESARLSSCDSPGAVSTVCDSEDEDYSTITAVSIPPA